MIVCDVCIIGAGPAGASLALFLAASGVHTVLVEKKSRIDSPVRCAELVTRKMAGLFDFRIRGVDHTIRVMDTYIQFQKQVQTASPGFMLNRPVFVQDLVQRFVAQGGQLIMACRALSVEPGPRVHPGGWPRFYLSRLGHGGGWLTVKSKMAVAADGPLSVAAKAENSVGLKTMAGYQKNLAIQARAGDRALIFFAPFIRGGYGWLFPKSESVNLGIGMHTKLSQKGARLEIRKAFGRFQDMVFSRGFLDKAGLSGENGKSARAVSGLIPVSGMVPAPVSRGLVRVGDAAGLCHPITGAGIYPAVYSAKMAAPHIIRAARGSAAELGPIKAAYTAAFGRSQETAVKNRKILESAEVDNMSAQAYVRLVKKTWVAFREYWS